MKRRHRIAQEILWDSKGNEHHDGFLQIASLIADYAGTDDSPAGSRPPWIRWEPAQVSKYQQAEQILKGSEVLVFESRTMRSWHEWSFTLEAWVKVSAQQSLELISRVSPDLSIFDQDPRSRVTNKNKERQKTLTNDLVFHFTSFRDCLEKMADVVPSYVFTLSSPGLDRDSWWGDQAAKHKPEIKDETSHPYYKGKVGD